MLQVEEIMAPAKKETAVKKRSKIVEPAAAATKKVKWTFPRATLEKALQLPSALKEHNGGNPWDTDELRKAVGASTGGNNWFYLAAASRDYGLTSGSSSTETIGLENLGREIVYAPNEAAELESKKSAFMRVEVFKKVLAYYKGSNLPDMKYLGNTLTREFNLEPETHEEFAKVFRENCTFLGITSGDSLPSAETHAGTGAESPAPDTITLSEGDSKTSPTAFVILPFVERDPKHPPGFFAEVLRSIITPAAADFKVKTANRQGSDVIQSTIINDLDNADLVIADLTEHNPNVMFELGFRMANDKPVVLLKAEGTGPLFDVDNMLRVFEYNPNLWTTTIEKDMPNLRQFIKGAWENRASSKTYVKILRGRSK
jgi:hypothetical protein